MVSPLLLLIHRGPIEMSKAGSGEGGGRITALHPQISSIHSRGLPRQAGLRGVRIFWSGEGGGVSGVPTLAFDRASYVSTYLSIAPRM